MARLGGTAMFSARFREAAGRALLLPRRRPGQRAPLWQQRKRAADLLAVAARFGSFPIVLEAYRECLRDVFDLPALVDLLTKVRSRTVRVATVDARTSSPFAASLLFGYVANYMYDGDAPLAERRAHALSVDQTELAALIGEGELRTLVDVEALATIETDLQQTSPRLHVKSTDGVHDLLLRLGDLSAAEIDARALPGVAGAAARDAGRRPARRADPTRRRDAAHRRRRRRALPRRPRHATAAGAAGVAARAVARRHRRSRAPLRAHARPVHGAGRRGALRPRRVASWTPRCSGWRPPDASSRASSGPAAMAASGATRTCCARCAGARSRRCARTSSRSSPRCSAASSPRGTA